jgi:hypothetical protein
MSVHEPTWSRELKMHTCCGSKHAYHVSSCPVRKAFMIPGRPGDPNFIKVQALKLEGLNSLQIATQLSLALDEVNELFIL